MRPAGPLITNKGWPPRDPVHILVHLQATKADLGRKIEEEKRNFVVRSGDIAKTDSGISGGGLH